MPSSECRAGAMGVVLDHGCGAFWYRLWLALCLQVFNHLCVASESCILHRFDHPNVGQRLCV